MSILRELVARLGFQVDDKGFKRAESRIDGIRAGLAKLGQVAAAAGIGAALKKIVDFASDAQETANVLEQVFGAQGAAAVKGWADSVSREMGRSKFELQEFAGRMGAMLDPMVKNTALAQEMSTTMAQLAVDLGSFFNATDEEALVALRAGLSGESEPLKRFGVVLQDATLQEFAHAQGVRKKVQAMSVAEKAELRYRFILANTTKAQGDAARTSESYANSSKAVRAALRDLATDMGTAVLPKIERALRVVRNFIDRFKQLTDGTYLLQSAMLVLSAIAAALGLSLLAPFIVPAAAVLALTLLIDDLHALFTGGTSVIGHYLDKLLGIGTADAVVQGITASVQIMSQWWHDLVSAVTEFIDLMPDAQGAWDIMAGAAEAFGLAAATAVQQVFDWILKLTNAAYEMFRTLAGLAGIKLPNMDPVGRNDRTSGRGVNAPIMSNMEQIQKTVGDRQHAIRAEVEARAAARRELSAGSKALESGSRAVGRGIDAPAIAFGHARASATEAVVSAPAAPPAAPPVNQVTVGGTTMNLTVNGGNLAEVRRVVRETLEAERRKTAAAIPKAGH